MNAEILKSLVFEKVKENFAAYLEDHHAAIENESDRIAFIKLINNNDEYTKHILDGLWAKFEVEHLTDEKLKEIADNIQKSFGIEI